MHERFNANETDWARIVALYEVLAQVNAVAESWN